MTPTGRRKKASLGEVAMWVKDAWNDLPAAIIVYAFKKCCIANALNGTQDGDIWDGKDACQESDNFPSSDKDDTPISD